MLAAERRSLILERLERDGSVLVASLSAVFGVSEETIRRDLEKLEKSGFAERCYGGASFAGGRRELPYSVRKKSNVAGKQKIAAAIAESVPDGSFIMLDESSTSDFVARALSGKRRITLITNSIETVVAMAGEEDRSIMLTGGSLKHGVMSLTGRRTEDFIRGYHVDLAVISCTGVDLKTGFTDAGEDNALIKRAMMESADRVVLAADSSKLGKTAFAPIGRLTELAALVTDKEPDEEWKQALEEAGVKLIY